MGNILLISAGTSCTDIIQAVSSIIVAGVALYAVSDWKKEKNYDLHIECLVCSKKAIDFMDRLRSRLVSDSEIINKETITGQRKSTKPGSDLPDLYAIFHSRMHHNNDIYTEILTLREKT